MVLWNFNWLCKHIKNIRSIKDVALRNFCTELGFPLRVSLGNIRERLKQSMVFGIYSSTFKITGLETITDI